MRTDVFYSIRPFFAVITISLLKTYSVSLNTSNYFLPNGIRQITFSAAAYCTEPLFHSNKIERWNCDACELIPNITANVFRGRTKDVNGYVAYDKEENEIIIAFSGTEAISKKNWLDDLDYSLIDYPYCDRCRVHAGFYSSFLSVKVKIESMIHEFKSAFPTAKISVTGHSLGAALALFALAEFSNDKSYQSIIISEQYVFGCPRIGNKAFADWFSVHMPITYRMVHKKDPVPHLPLRIMDFYHVRYEVFYEDDYELCHVCSQSGEDEKCSNQYSKDLNLYDHLRYLNVNFIENWISCIV